MTSGVILARTS